MKMISVIWGVLLALSVCAFAALSVVISIKGWGELRDIFRSLGASSEQKNIPKAK